MKNSHRRHLRGRRIFGKKILVMPLVVRKHPVQTLGLTTLSLGVLSGLLWYNLKK